MIQEPLEEILLVNSELVLSPQLQKSFVAFGEKKINGLTDSYCILWDCGNIDQTEIFEDFIEAEQFYYNKIKELQIPISN